MLCNITFGSCPSTETSVKRTARELTTEDLTQEELNEMPGAARDRDNPDIVVLDGYFGSPIPLTNIQFRKMCENFPMNKE